MSGTPVDFSDQIAWVQVCLQILEGFEPNGEWSNHALVKKWRKSTYSLNRREFVELQKFLTAERQRVTTPKPIEYDQPSLFGGLRNG